MPSVTLIHSYKGQRDTPTLGAKRTWAFTFINNLSCRSFIGDKLNLAFTPQDLLTNEIIPRNTSSEGSNWLEFLTGCFEGSPLNCTQQLWNFAFAGSDIDGDLLPLHHDFTVPLVDQVAQWVTYGSTVIPHPKNETLTTWWIGINDTGDSNRNTSITNFTAFWETEMTSYFNAVELAAQHGLMTHLFLNVPPEERSPGSLGNPGQLKDHIGLFNSVLANHITQFERSHPGLSKRGSSPYLKQRFTATQLHVLDSPAEFGFSDVTGYGENFLLWNLHAWACESLLTYGMVIIDSVPVPTQQAIFGTLHPQAHADISARPMCIDSGHPTQRVHQLLADAVRDQLLGV
ncbi:hypothetical protein D9756_004685 [Leucocoprinus leucothites]|uniref:Carbohydrate esterase family 16 protein n=1 Tax=Leucocoprinus leucothites TaxID=201217 RepID=A0A8H5G8P9_9AGAR|nr:hypothetical protein D9756_004685 [Leucoagaricus leucothites]